jgi:MbtH protein
VNPFDDEDATFVVVINDEGQHSLWPEQMEIPRGWSVVYGPGLRKECIDYIDEHWTDMRPLSLAAWMRGG